MCIQISVPRLCAVALLLAAACQSPQRDTEAPREPAISESEAVSSTGEEETPGRSVDLSVDPMEPRGESDESEAIEARNEAILARLKAEEVARTERENREALEEEVEGMRAEMDELRRERDAGSDHSDAQNRDNPRTNDSSDARAEAEREWRPVFAEFRKRYREKKGELDTTLDQLKQYQAWCNYTRMGEPSPREKKMGVRQEGIQMGAITELKKVGYSASCETIDFDIKRAKQERFDTLRDIQKECYDEATYRGVSTAKARLR